MMKDSCQTGYFIDIKHDGPCRSWYLFLMLIDSQGKRGFGKGEFYLALMNFETWYFYVFSLNSLEDFQSKTNESTWCALFEDQMKIKEKLLIMMQRNDEFFCKWYLLDVSL